MSDTSALDDTAFMDALLSVLVPANPPGGLPAAGTLGLAAQVASGLKSDPMLGPMVGPGAQAIREAALAAHPDGLPGMPPEEAKQLIGERLAANPAVVLGLLRYLYPAYYGHPRVLEGIGEPPRPPFPEGFEVEPTDAELLDLLKERARPPRAGR
jgi:hypothetical protein